MSENITVKEVVLHAKEIVNGKQKFVACSMKVNDRWFKVKFRKCCADAPKEKGLYRMAFNYDDVSIEFGKDMVGKNGKKFKSDDTVWVSKLIFIEKFTEEELAARNRDMLASAFGD